LWARAPNRDFKEEGVRDYKKLEVFHLADSLALRIYKATSKSPADERFGLTSQLRRAAVSVGANIVEAAARSSQGDFARLLHVAYGSACEMEYELSLAGRLRYLSPAQFDELSAEALRLVRALRGFILAVKGNRS
jgi:four helix bundle protein